MTPKTENRKPKTASYASPAHAAADQLLAAWQAADLEVKRLELEFAAELAAMEQKWAEKVERAQEKRDHYDAALKVTMKLHRATLFPVVGLGSFTLALPAGALRYDKTEHVVKARQVLANLERYGFEEVLRRTVKVDWDALADKKEWPDEVLEEILGTRREVKETFGFEAKAVSGEQGAVSGKGGQNAE